jgi:hypothetical protein
MKYLLNPAVQLVQLKAGDRTAMAIVAALASNEGKKVLLVDSFESKSHIFARKNVSKIALQGLIDYARASGFDQLLVSGGELGNPAPREFYKNIEGESKTVFDEFKLVESPMPYLETLHQSSIEWVHSVKAFNL